MSQTIQYRELQFSKIVNTGVLELQYFLLRRWRCVRSNGLSWRRPCLVVCGTRLVSRCRMHKFFMPALSGALPDAIFRSEREKYVVLPDAQGRLSRDRAADLYVASLYASEGPGIDCVAAAFYVNVLLC
jgi:hypothetical protein